MRANHTSIQQRRKFLQLQGQTATFDLMEYAIPPVDQVLGMLVWMVKH